jgi:hypothetical protein
MTKKQADALCKEWNEKNKPGCMFKVDGRGDEVFRSNGYAYKEWRPMDQRWECYLPFADGSGYDIAHLLVLCYPLNQSASTPEPAPKPNDLPAVWELVKQDMEDRNRFGFEKYGTPLQPHNGRKALRDAYQEALDLAVYLRQEIFEREGK